MLINPLRRFELQLFSDGGGQGGEGGSGGGAAGGSGSGGSGGEGGAGGQGGQGGETKPFAVFQDAATFAARMERESHSKLEAMAKELGYESVDAMKTAAKAKKDADEAAKTELEKAQAAAQKAEDEKKAALETANRRLVDAEIRIQAQASGFADYTDAVALVDRSTVEVDKDGNISGVKEAVEALAKAKPHLVGEKKPAGSDGSGGNGGRQGGGGTQTSWEQGQEAAKKRNEERKATANGQGW